MADQSGGLIQSPIGPKELAAGEVTVKLEPEAYVVGRLLDEDGEPFSGAAIEASGIPFDYVTRLDKVGADADGRFRAVLIPGIRYSLQCETNRAKSTGFMIDRDLTLEPGETRDLGTLQFSKKGKRIESTPTNEKAKQAAGRAAPLRDQAELEGNARTTKRLSDVNWKSRWPFHMWPNMSASIAGSSN